MKKRIVSLFLVLALCLSLLPTAVFAETPSGADNSTSSEGENITPAAPEEGKDDGSGNENEPPAPGGSTETGGEGGEAPVFSGAPTGQSVTGNEVAEVDGTKYETLQEILEGSNEVTITLLGNVTEDLTVYAATTIIMNGYSITGDVEAYADLTLTSGTVDGTVTVDGGTLNMTAPETAEAAITKGLTVNDGSAYVSGAKVGVKTSLYFDGDNLTISGSERAVSLLGDPTVTKTLHGATSVDGDATLPTEYDAENGTYMIGISIAQKIVCVNADEPETPVTLTIDPMVTSVNAGETATFTVTYNGADTLEADIQKSALDENIEAPILTNKNDGTYTITVKVAEEAPSRDYTLHVYEKDNTSVKASATINVKGKDPAAEVISAGATEGTKYFSLPAALNAAQDGDTVKMLANHVMDWDAVDAGDESTLAIVTKKLTLGLNGKTVDYLMVGEMEVDEENQTITATYPGNLTVVSNGGGATATGTINALDLVKGTLELQSGQIGYSGESGLTCNGDSGNVTISGGTVLGLTVGVGASVTVTGGSLHAGDWYNNGTLSITGGTFNNVNFYERAGTIAISGGTFGTITNRNESTIIPPMSLLANGHAFYDQYEPYGVKDGSQVDSLRNVTVKEHTHTMGEDKKCACGLSCSHGGKNGFDGTNCPYCNAPAVAETALNNSEGRFLWRRFADLQTAIDADRDGGAEFKLLADVNGEYTINGTQNTALNLNGHSIKGKLIVTGEGRQELSLSNSGSTGTIQEVVASKNAKFGTPGYPAVIGTLELAEGATWENIVNPARNPGYKVYTSYPDPTTYTWYAPKDEQLDSTTELKNVTIDRLPITSKSLTIVKKADGSRVSSTVERNTELQLRASCNAKDAKVTFWVGKKDTNGSYDYVQLSGDKVTYQQINRNWYYVAEYTFNEIGEFIVYFIAEKDGYEVTSTSKKLTVTKLDLSNAVISFRNNNESTYEPARTTISAPGFTVTYNGKTLKLGDDYTASGTVVASAAGVSTQTLTIQAVEGSDYTGSKTAEWKIVPHKAKVEVGDVIKAYDGTTDLPDDKISLVSAAGSAGYEAGKPLPLSAGNGFELTDAKYDSADASETEKSISFTVKLTNKNYTFEDGTTEKAFTLNGADEAGTFKINQATVKLPDEINLYVYNDAARIYTLHLASLRPSLTLPCEYGETQYRMTGYDFTNNAYLDGDDAVSVSSKDGTLTLSTAAANSSNVGDQIGKITVTVVTTNYQEFKFTINVVIGEKIWLDQSGVTVTATDITYGQTLADSTLTATGSMICPRTKEVIPGTFAWTNPSTKPDASESYQAEWTFTPAEGYEEYAPATGKVSVKVNPKSIAGATINLKHTSYEYTGEDIRPELVSVVLDGVELECGRDKDYYYSYSYGKDVWKYGFTIFGFNNYTGDVTVNWYITPKTVTPEITVASCTYTGDALEPEVTLKDGETVIDPKEYEVSYSNNTNAGAGLVTITDKEGGNYVIKERSQDFPISQADAPKAAPGTLNVINGATLKYTYDFSQLLPKLTGNAKFGTIAYRSVNVTSLAQGYGYDTVNVDETTGALTLKLISTFTQLEPGTSAGTVSVRVYSTNFKSFLLELNLNPINQIKPVADGDITASEITYGDELSKSTISGKMKDPNTGAEVKGTFLWKDGTIKPNAGDYQADWTFTPAAGYEKYASTTGKVSVTVNPKSIKGAIVTLNAYKLVYTGEYQRPNVVSVVLDGETLVHGNNFDYECMYSQGQAVGTYRISVGGINNYTDTVTVEWSITPREVTPTIEVASCTYGGTAQEPKVTVKDDLGNTIDPKEYKATYSNNINAGTGTVTIKDDFDDSNYVINTTSTTFTIGQASMESPKPIEQYVYNDLARDYEIDLKDYLPELTSPCDYGDVSYSIDRKTENYYEDYYAKESATIEGSNLLLPIKKASSVKSGNKVVTLTVQVISTNYKPFDLYVGATLKDKIEPKVDNVKATDITFGQTLADSTISGKMKDPTTGEEVKGTFSWKDGTVKPDKAGDYTADWVFTPDAPEYATVTGTVTVTVAKASIIEASVSEPSYTYDGNSHTPAPEVTLDGKTLVEGTDYTVSADPQINAGNYEMKIIGKGNYHGGDSKTYPWHITPRTVESPTVTVADGVYNEGKAVKPTVIVKDGDTVIPETEYTVSYSDNTNAGTGTVTITNKDGGNYVLGTVNETFTIKQAKGGSLGEYTQTQKYTYEQDFNYSLDWSKLPEKQTWRYSTAASVSEGSNATVTKNQLSDDGKTLTYAISGGKAGDTVTSTLKASCKNYEDFTITLTVTLKELDAQSALTVKGEGIVTYGETITLTAEGGSGTGEVTFKVEPTPTPGAGDAEIDPITGVLTPKKVGTVYVTATKAGDKDYNAITSVSFLVRIMQAETTGAPKYDRITSRGSTLDDADLRTEGSTLDPIDGNLEWIDEDGNVLPGSTKVEANKRYKWRFTPDDTNYAILTGEILLYRVSGGGIGSGVNTNVKKDPDETPSGSFIDIPSGSYYEDAVAWAVENGITTGTDSMHFSPDDVCTRAQAVTFLWRAAGSPKPKSSTMPFTDVPRDSYFYEAVLWAVENGITNGTSDTAFSPDAKCSRAQIVAFLWRSESTPASGSSNPFADVHTSAYYAKAVLWAVEEDITKGTSATRFSPDMHCTRAQIVTFLWRCKK